MLDEQQRALLRRCLVESLDTGLHDFLFRLQEDRPGIDRIEILVDGVSIIPLSDGLQMELFGEDGWLARLSAFGASPSESDLFPDSPDSP